jgi:hypothetical protein
MMNANTRDAECIGKGRVERHAFRVTAIHVRLGFFQFGPVFDEFRSAHSLFFLWGKNDDTG